MFLLARCGRGAAPSFAPSCPKMVLFCFYVFNRHGQCIYYGASPPPPLLVSPRLQSAVPHRSRGWSELTCVTVRAMASL
eukprot:COSAG01_NODE_2267_length_8037_cov_2.630054_1_plen_79_part_00